MTSACADGSCVWIGWLKPVASTCCPRTTAAPTGTSPTWSALRASLRAIRMKPSWSFSPASLVMWRHDTGRPDARQTEGAIPRRPMALCHHRRVIGKIVSGGQTGVDRAALDVAQELGIPRGGWCPRGRLAEDGPIDARYPLEETPSP